jgi:hypothetical protein
VITISGEATRIPEPVEVYEAIQAYLKEVAMNVEFNIVEPSVCRAMTGCGIGLALNEVLQAIGRGPEKDTLTLDDKWAATNQGSANCPAPIWLRMSLPATPWTSAGR